MASSGDVGAFLEAVVVEQQPAESCNGGESGLPAATTTTEERRPTMLQEQRQDDNDTAEHPAPAASSEQAAAEVSASASASEESPEQQKAAPPVATEEVEVEQRSEADDQAAETESTRERLKRHRREMAGRVWVPEMWGQEKLLKDWVDCAVFDRPMVPAGLLTARRALIAECCTRRPDRRTSPASSAGSSPLRVPNGCS